MTLRMYLLFFVSSCDVSELPKTVGWVHPLSPDSEHLLLFSKWDFSFLFEGTNNIHFKSVLNVFETKNDPQEMMKK